MTTTTPSPPRGARGVADIAVGLLLALITGYIGLLLLAFVQQLAGLSAACEGVAADGPRCNPDYLGGMLIAASAGIVFGWFLPVGFMIMRFVQRRVAFFLPIIALLIMIAVVYAVSAALSAYQATT